MVFYFNFARHNLDLQCQLVQSNINRYEYLWADGHNIKTPLKVSAS